MHLKTLDHVTVMVKDLDRSLEFYRDMLGLKVITWVTHDGPGDIDNGRFAQRQDARGANGSSSDRQHNNRFDRVGGAQRRKQQPTTSTMPPRLTSPSESKTSMPYMKISNQRGSNSFRLRFCFRPPMAAGGHFSSMIQTDSCSS